MRRISDMAGVCRVMGALLMATAIAGCDQKKDTGTATPAAANASLALPLTIGPVTAPSPAPAVTAMPAAAPAPVVQVSNPDEAYAYLDRANATSDAIGQAPPDYGFDYAGVHPWVWHSDNGCVTLVEPVDGGYRYYYYQPGASTPYLVRDADYSYGYSGSQLVVVYDAEGRLLATDQIGQQADFAGRYLARAQALYRASLQNERRAVNAANWAARRAALDAERAQWQAQQAQQAAWRAYHQAHAAEEQAYWQGERDQRRADAQAFEAWSRKGFGGPPPPAHPASRVPAVAQRPALPPPPATHAGPVRQYLSQQSRPAAAQPDQHAADHHPHPAEPGPDRRPPPPHAAAPAVVPLPREPPPHSDQPHAPNPAPAPTGHAPIDRTRHGPAPKPAPPARPEPPARAVSPKPSVPPKEPSHAALAKAPPPSRHPVDSKNPAGKDHRHDENPPPPPPGPPQH